MIPMTHGELDHKKSLIKKEAMPETIVKGPDAKNLPDSP